LNFIKKIIFLFSGKHYRYIISGLLVFFFNLLIADFIFSFPVFQKNTAMMNAGNIIATEIAFLISFPIHKFFTWLEGPERFFQQLVKFHLVSATSFGIRWSLFFLLTVAGLTWFPSTLISMIFIVLINFMGFDRFVFKDNEEKMVTPDNAAYSSDGAGVGTLETIEEAVNYNLWLSEKIEDFLGNKNIEFGAGTGTIAAILSEKYPLEVFEISKHNTAVLKKRFKNNPRIQHIGGDLYANKKFGKYDCIYSSNVLEHIEDDISIIDHSLRLLKKGGYFVSIVPAMPLLFSKIDAKLGHFRRYGIKDRSRIKKIDFIASGKAELIRYSFFNPVGAVGWFVKMKLLGNEAIKVQDAMLMNTLIPYISILDYIPLPFGQSILIVIKKL